MRRYRKPYLYPPGLISLVLLPILILIYLYQSKAFQVEYAIEFNVQTKRDVKQIMDLYGWESKPNRNYLNHCLQGDDAKDQATLKRAQMALRNMMQNRDTTIGVHFEFKDNAHYWTFIRTLDLCEIEHVIHFTSNSSHIWAYYISYHPKPSEVALNFKRLFCGTQTSKLNELKIKERANKVEKRSAIYKAFLIQFWGQGLIFLLLVVVAFINIKRSF